ncbi:hypothetical protein F3Y22_tig00111013pilonHSYRG00159 [Hibiscus syriacus]|uniref:Uncharacterized protein n=1 Tax=Hibiscus syriacus TaxID=106335 RepID=A0A6A2Z6F0_HIBSY|nr:hypothetical protein F3Y22_tig00111013pilonHSYRG00159 [Hibiscus syriacus]
MCEGETIISLHLKNLGLSGSIDVEALSQLRSLRTIRLVKNAFTGPIPEFNKLRGLRAIYLSNNQFSGEISDTYFGSMGKLREGVAESKQVYREHPKLIDATIQPSGIAFRRESVFRQNPGAEIPGCA